jgi:HEXXH motif-containing protein
VLGEDERRIILERLTASRDLIRKTSGAVGAFVARFTKVIVLRRDDQSLGSSASSWEHIGRCLVGNPHVPGTDEIHLAEVLVHQAVHSLLSMQQLVEPRVLGPAAHETVSLVRSPWTGDLLPVSLFLRECFARYGLLNFWCLALGVGASDPERIRGRMREALRGFMAAPLLDTVPADAAMSDEAGSAIAQMQEVVASSFDAVVA